MLCFSVETAQWTLRDIGNMPMNTPQYCQLRSDACEYITFLLSLQSDEFHGRFGSLDPYSQQPYEMAQNL